MSFSDAVVGKIAAFSVDETLVLFAQPDHPFANDVRKWSSQSIH
jgi:hypothetical protein